jgi:hypothetical protein
LTIIINIDSLSDKIETFVAQQWLDNLMKRKIV